MNSLLAVVSSSSEPQPRTVPGLSRGRSHLAPNTSLPFNDPLSFHIEQISRGAPVQYCSGRLHLERSSSQQLDVMDASLGGRSPTSGREGAHLPRAETEKQVCLDILVLSGTLNSGCNLQILNTDGHRDHVHQLLAQADSGYFSPSLFIHGLEFLDTRPTHCGTITDVYRGLYKGELVAIKRARLCQSDRSLKPLQLVSGHR